MNGIEVARDLGIGLVGQRSVEGSADIADGQNVTFVSEWNR